MKNHIHCLICSDPYEYDYDFEGDNPTLYICNACAHSFNEEYLMYRINCAKNNIHKKSFDILEQRLTWGQDMPTKFADHEEIFQWK